MIPAARISSRCAILQIRNKTKHAANYHNSTKLLLSKEGGSKSLPKDPHQIASDMVRKAPDSRISGSEALESITPEQKMKNYATAVGLLCFCTGVWYYSIQSVGKADGGMDDLRAEAKEAMDELDKKNMEERNAEELAQLDISMASYGDGDNGVIVAVAAPDEIAEMEDRVIKVKGEKKSGRPLWKKIVLFWKRD